MPQAMPKHLKTIRTRGGFGTLVRERADFLPLIGMVTLAWTDLERTIHRLLTGVLMGSSTLALAAVSEVIDTRLKIQLTIAALRASPNWPETIEVIDYLAENPLKSVQKRRNKVVHGEWSICDDVPGTLVETDSLRVLSKSESRSWTSDDFISLINDIQCVNDEIGRKAFPPFFEDTGTR